MGKKSYKELQNELDMLLEKFESSSHDDIDTMLKDYEKGMKLIGELENNLSEAELKLKKMKNTVA